MMEDKDIMKSKKLWVIGGLVVVGMWCLNIFLPYFIYFKDNPCNVWESIGQFGDQFGAVNALFSGGALLFIVITLYYQTQQLRLQREDLKVQQKMLKQSIEESEEQTEEFKKQVSEMNLQRLENTFYNLVFRMVDSVDRNALHLFLGIEPESYVPARIRLKEETPKNIYDIIGCIKLKSNVKLMMVVNQIDYIIQYIKQHLDTFDNDKYYKYLTCMIDEEVLKMIICFCAYNDTHMNIVRFLYDNNVTISNFSSKNETEKLSHIINDFHKKHIDYKIYNSAEKYLARLNKAEASE